MSDKTPTVVTRTVWHLTAADWIDNEPDCSTIAVTVKGNGDEYAVVCSGPKGMSSTDFIGAMRVAVAGLIRAGGGDMSVVGCGTLEGDSTFDTGDQRAS